HDASVEEWAAPEESPSEVFVFIFDGPVRYERTGLVHHVAARSDHSNLRMAIEKCHLTFESSRPGKVVVILQRNVFTACSRDTFIRRFGDTEVALVADDSHPLVFELSENLRSAVD